MSENFWLGLLLDGADKRTVAPVQRALTDWEEDWEDPAEVTFVGLAGSTLTYLQLNPVRDSDLADDTRDQRRLARRVALAVGLRTWVVKNSDSGGGFVAAFDALGNARWSFQENPTKVRRENNSIASRLARDVGEQVLTSNGRPSLINAFGEPVRRARWKKTVEAFDRALVEKRAEAEAKRASARSRRNASDDERNAAARRAQLDEWTRDVAPTLWQALEAVGPALEAEGRFRGGRPTRRTLDQLPARWDQPSPPVITRRGQVEPGHGITVTDERGSSQTFSRPFWCDLAVRRRFDGSLWFFSTTAIGALTAQGWKLWRGSIDTSVTSSGLWRVTELGDRLFAFHPTVMVIVDGPSFEAHRIVEPKFSAAVLRSAGVTPRDGLIGVLPPVGGQRGVQTLGERPSFLVDGGVTELDLGREVIAGVVTGDEFVGVTTTHVRVVTATGHVRFDQALPAGFTATGASLDGNSLVVHGADGALVWRLSQE